MLLQALGLRKVEVTQAAIAALPQHTSPEICAFQQADPIIQELLGFWEQKQRPSHEERAQLSQSTLFLLRQWDRLVKKDGILYRQVFHSDGAEAVLQMLLPGVLRSKVLPKSTRSMGIREWSEHWRFFGLSVIGLACLLMWHNGVRHVRGVKMFTQQLEATWGICWHCAQRSPCY